MVTQKSEVIDIPKKYKNTGGKVESIAILSPVIEFALCLEILKVNIY